MKTLKTSNITHLISSRTDYNEEVVKEILGSFIEIIKEVTEAGEHDVSMWRFGRFYSAMYKNKRKLYFESKFKFPKKVETVETANDQLNRLRHIKW